MSSNNSGYGYSPQDIAELQAEADSLTTFEQDQRAAAAAAETDRLTQLANAEPGYVPDEARGYEFG